MKLNTDQLGKLNSFIKENWKPPATCNVCKSNNWNIADSVYELREFHGGGLVVGGGGGGIVPLCPVTCNTCGNTVLINPLVAGIDLGGEKNDSK